MSRALRITRSLAELLRVFAFAFLIPIPVSLLYDEHTWAVPGLGIHVPWNAVSFLLCFLAAIAVAIPLRTLTERKLVEGSSDRDGYLMAALSLLVAPLFAGLPFLIGGLFRSPVDAYFEAMAGVTTSGFTAIRGDLEAVAPSLHFWRGQLQWMGGLGIIVLGVTTLSRLTTGGLQMVRAESLSQASRRLRPKTSEAIRAVVGTYAIVSAGILILLFLALRDAGVRAKQAAFEATFHTFTTFSTGGFTLHREVSGFYSASVEGILMLAMILGSTHILILMSLRPGRWTDVAKDPEWRFHLATMGFFALATVVLLAVRHISVADNLRAALFTAVSMVSTTGTVTTSYVAWGAPVFVLVLAMMLIGGTSGSTAGGIKSFRLLLMGKMVARELRRLLHPRAVVPVRAAGRTVPEPFLSATAAFLVSYVLAWVGGLLLLTVFVPNLGMLDAAGGSAAALGNGGAALGRLGPGTLGVAAMPVAGKLVMAGLMWFGRLELFTALLLFVPATWRN